MRMIFVNLPVKDVQAARAFWSALGFGINETYSDDTTACVVLEENICVMLLVEPRFQDFVNGELHDPASSTSALYCLSAADRAEVDGLVERALAAGAKPWKPVLESGPMYGHSFQDPDGHVWEVLAIPGAGS